MLALLKNMQGMPVVADDGGDSGRLHDFLFDDETWSLRHVVVDIKKWRPGGKVLVPADVVAEPDPGTRRLPVELSTQEIKDSPALEADPPVSRQTGWQFSMDITKIPLTSGLLAKRAKRGKPKPPDTGSPHLRSMNEVIKYQVYTDDSEGSNGDKIGQVDDFVADTEDWTVRYIIVETRKLMQGRKVIVSRDSASGVDWDTRKVFLRMTRKEIKESPVWNTSLAQSRENEEKLAREHDFPIYWKTNQ